MDSVMNKAGSYLIGQKASKEFSSVTNDLNVRSFLLTFLETLFCNNVIIQYLEDLRWAFFDYVLMFMKSLNIVFNL